MRIIVLLAVVLTGCTRWAWEKEGASKQDFNVDNYACMREAQQPGSSAYIGQYGGAAQSSVRMNQHLYHACMKARGWEPRRESKF
jgi:hypothetical protein